MRLFIIRHGETEANASSILQGHSDNPLSARGIEQSRSLGAHLKSLQPHEAYVSDLQRALQTYHFCFDGKVDSLVRDTDLRERSYGSFEGQSIDIHMAAFHASGHTKESYRPTGGESYLDVEKRAARFLQKLSSGAPNRSVVIVAHGGINRMLLKILLNLSFDEAFRIDQANTCINEIEIRQSSMISHRLNCTKHLV